MGARSKHIVLLTVLALAGCGDDDESASGTTTALSAAAPEATSATPATAVEPAEPTAADTVAATTDVQVSPSPPSDPAGAGAGASGCSVTITGDVSAEWSSSVSGPTAFVYGGWLINPGPDDANAFGINCFDSDFNIVGFTASPGTEIPMKPATYQLPRSFDPGSPINAEVALLFDEGVWEISGGQLDIVEFDDTHIRGTFSLAIHDGFDTTRTAEVTGEFAHSR